jgi:hypothetical protein
MSVSSRVVDLARIGRHAGSDVGAQRSGVAQPLGDAYAGNKTVQVRRGGEVARVDDRRVGRVGTGKADVSGSTNSTAKVSPWPGGGFSPSPTNGTGHTSSTSGAVNAGSLRTKATASITLEVSMPRRASRNRTSWTGESAATRVSASGSAR